MNWRRRRGVSIGGNGDEEFVTHRAEKNNKYFDCEQLKLCLYIDTPYNFM